MIDKSVWHVREPCVTGVKIIQDAKAIVLSERAFRRYNKKFYAVKKLAPLDCLNVERGVSGDKRGVRGCRMRQMNPV